MEAVRVLLDLQEMMSRARQVELERNRVPLEAADLKGLFEETEARFLAAQQEFEEVKTKRREKEREIEEERSKVERAKAKLMTIKTNKEYFAMLKEIEQTRRANAQREEELLAILARYEEVEKRLAALRAEVEEVGGRYRERMAEVEARMSAFDRDIAALLAKKAEVAARLDSGLVRRFELIFERRDGLAIVPALAQGGVASCAGCHMNISPQLFNLLQREDRIYTCPNCNRMLYFERPSGDDAAR